MSRCCTSVASNHSTVSLLHSFWTRSFLVFQIKSRGGDAVLFFSLCISVSISCPTRRIRWNARIRTPVLHPRFCRLFHSLPCFKIKREASPVSFFTSPDSLFTSSRLRFLQFNRVHLYMMSLPSFHLPCLHVFSFVVPCVSLISRDCVLIRIMFLSCSTSPWPRHETPKYTVIERNRYRTYGGVSVVGALSGGTMRNRLPARVRKMTNFGSGVPEDWNGKIGCLLFTRICS